MLSNESKTAEELERLQQVTEQERKRLEQELLKAAEEYLLKIQTMEVAHEEKVAKLVEQKEAEREVRFLVMFPTHLKIYMLGSKNFMHPIYKKNHRENVF